MALTQIVMKTFSRVAGCHKFSGDSQRLLMATSASFMLREECALHPPSHSASLFEQQISGWETTGLLREEVLLGGKR